MHITWVFIHPKAWKVPGETKSLEALPLIAHSEYALSQAS